MYAHVAKFNTFKLMLALAAIYNWIVHIIDINNAFLHDDIEETIYMKLPKGYTPKGVLPPQAVCYLGSKTATTPMEPNVKLSKDNGQPVEEPTAYRSLIGKMIYLTITRSDINYDMQTGAAMLTQGDQSPDIVYS
ncbi:uncharacterized protein LOC133814837 [Humulus lupulus]|uniref:uncharacterized protein LOC133814837 n=1 Tax=Humulus lupulus TaxID=3486 RepID=UPI002B406763|nr:uncharacterized protein LOC133814837 [Humulus lupulus]